MRKTFIYLFILFLVGCTAPKYIWRNSPNDRTSLRVYLNFDPKMNLNSDTQKIYNDAMIGIISNWADVILESQPSNPDDIILQINISCECKNNFLKQADATMNLISIFDHDRSHSNNVDYEQVQISRIGYGAEDMQGNFKIYSKQTANHPYHSVFFKTHIMYFMDPLSSDSKLVATNRSREQAKGLARLIINDLQKIELLPQTPIRMTVDIY